MPFTQYRIDPNSRNSSAPPTYKGFEQLVVILDEQGQHAEAMRLCERAKDDDWEGNWDKRIARYRKKLK